MTTRARKRSAAPAAVEPHAFVVAAGPAVAASPAAPEQTVRLHGTDFQRVMDPGTGRTQALAGFDPEYTDIVQYIVACTHRIWEETGMGLIYTHYLHNVKVHTADGWYLGRDKVVGDSIATKSAFPDARVTTPAVVWTGNEQDGFYTSHLIFNVSRNTGHSVYGPPTGRQVTRMGIALCLVKENRIVEEWVVRDDLSVIRQLGLDLDATVARLARREAAKPLQNYGDPELQLGQYAPEPYPAPAKSGTGFEVDDFVRRSYHEIWNRRMFNLVRDVVHENMLFHGPSGRECYGRGDYLALALSLLAAFPDARFSIDQLFWNADEATGGWRTSMRWSLVGTHTGYGIYGAPTGVPFRLWGLTQHVIVNGRFVEEWTVFNELALLKRLYLARQAPPPAP